MIRVRINSNGSFTIQGQNVMQENHEPHMQTGQWLALLGTKGGPAIRPGSTMPTSNLLCLGGKHIVIDCGLGVTRGIVDQGMSLKDLSSIFITHLHSDHYLELGPLLHTAWVAGLTSEVNVYGPAGIDQYWNLFLQSMDADITLRIADEGRPELAGLVQIHAIEAGEVYSDSVLEVRAMRNCHPPLVDTFALSFSHNESRVVFSGDTATMPELADFARDANLLVHEAMLEDALPALFERVGNGDERLKQHWMRSHTLAHDAARIASEAGVQALTLNHLIPSDDPDWNESHWRKAVGPHFDGVLHIGYDGLVISI